MKKNMASIVLELEKLDDVKTKQCFFFDSQIDNIRLGGKLITFSKSFTQNMGKWQSSALYCF